MTYFLLFLLLLILELAYFRVADRLNIIDRPNLRSSHTSVTIRGGGIIFLIGAWLWAAFFGLQYVWFMCGLTAISLISFADDVHSVPNRFRLVVQFASVMMMFADLGLWSGSLWWTMLPALVVAVGIINAYNFMDGINGITGGYSLAVLAPLLWLNRELCFVDGTLLEVASISALVFCLFNFRRHARCFAGDVGAIGMAFIVMFSLGRLMVQTGDLSYIIFIALYGVDTILTIVHRIMLHENLGKAHRKHAFQLMANELGMPHVVVSLLYMSLQLAVSFGLVFCPYHLAYAFAVCLVLGLAYIFFMLKYYHLHEEYLMSRNQ